MWQCGGRLRNVELAYSTKYPIPILLPHGHPVSALIVNYAHRCVCHNGVKETLTGVRRRYWIVKGRSFAKNIVHKCTVCKRYMYEAAPIRGPPIPPLPEFRVKDNPAFTYTGVDFAGPLFVRESSSSSSTKVWICLFTCLVTRAIHLDIVEDLSTNTFMRCLKRFAAQRGLPHKFTSDNGKTFKVAARLLDLLLKDDTIKEYLTTKGSQWERAPWWGGVFECMVRSTKRCLRKTIDRAHFSRDELLTAVVEIEGVINSRPLSYISSSDLEEPLTSSYLIVGRRLLSLPDNVDDPEDEDFEVDASHLQKRVKHLARVLNHFWKRCRAEYLNELRESHHHSAKKTPDASHVSKGDVVIVHDDSLPCGLWKLGRIQELFTGQDGLPRSALVRVSARDQQHMLLKRPLQLLYPLEVAGAEELEVSVENAKQDVCSTPDVPVASAKRPVRAAAVRANEWMKAWVQQFENEDQ